MNTHRFCIRRDNQNNFYLVEVRRRLEFDDWLKWINSVDRNAECFSDKFPIGNRISLEPPKYAQKFSEQEPLESWTWSEPKRFLACDKDLECGSHCIDDFGHDGDCLCAGDEDGESGTCPA